MVAKMYRSNRLDQHTLTCSNLSFLGLRTIQPFQTGVEDQTHGDLKNEKQMEGHICH